MARTSGQKTISTKLARIAKLAKEAPSMAITTLAHHMDVEWLEEAYRRTRKDGATGIDQQTAAEYGENLEENLKALLERVKSGVYQAPAVKRVYIPKGTTGQKRPIGIPTFEDKVLQRAVAMLLEAVYEQDFYDCSYGFRPKRSAHQALEALRNHLMAMRGGWVWELDIRKFFDSVDRGHMQSILRRRVRDGVLLRLIGKWLHAGVQEAGVLSYPTKGTPQGGVISPILANIFLHHVLDEWFMTEVKPRLRGPAHLIRYADDVVIVFATESDARRVMAVLPKRLDKYGLSLHPDKTRLVCFTRPPKGQVSGRTVTGPPTMQGPGTFSMLGFTHYWGRSLKGNSVVKRKTAKDRLRDAIGRINQWCRRFRHKPVSWQWTKLCQKLRGHYAYYGVSCNMRSLRAFYYETRRRWRRWLNSRSNRARMIWANMVRLLRRYPLPTPRIVHSAYPVANP